MLGALSALFRLLGLLIPPVRHQLHLGGPGRPRLRVLGRGVEAGGTTLSNRVLQLAALGRLVLWLRLPDLVNHLQQFFPILKHPDNLVEALVLRTRHLSVSLCALAYLINYMLV